MNIPTPNRRTLVRRGIAGTALGAVLLSVAACGTSEAGTDTAAPKGDPALTKLVPSDVAKKGTIVVGTQPDFEPANFTPVGESQIKGFNIDLMDAMAAKLGLKVDWQKVPFDQLLIGMQSHKFDATIAGMTDRKERQAQVDFIDYQVAGTVFMVQKGNPKHITSEVDGGCGIKIGDVKGSDAKRLVDMMAAACVKEGKPPTQLISFPSSSDKNLALVSGRVDAMFWPDMAVSVINRETDDKLESLPVNFEPKVYLGATFSKDDTQLRDAFFAALKAIHEDGTYAKILKKWDVEVIDLPTPGINLATS
jgi:polar amino acid transport system substrate-binding protein